MVTGNVASIKQTSFDSKLKEMDWLLIIVLFLQIGMKTYKSYDKPISLAVSILITLLFIYKCHFKLCMPRIISETFLWYTAILSWCVLSYLWATYNNQDYLRALVVNVYLPFVLTLICLGVYMMKTEDASLRVLRCLVVAEVISAARALVNSPILSIITTHNTKLYASRLGVNYNHYTTQLALVFIVSTFISANYNKKYRWSSAFLLSNILFSGSRKAILVSAIGLALIVIFRGNRKGILTKLKRAGFIAIIIVGVFLALMNVPALYNLIGMRLMLAVESIGQSAVEIAANEVIDHSAHGRAILREDAINQFLVHPILGLGYYCFQYFNRYGLYAHNNYLELLADLGIIGFGMYYYYYVSAFIRTCKNRNTSQTKELGTLFYIFLACILVVEYSHITFFRLYAVIPLVVVTVATQTSRRK